MCAYASFLYYICSDAFKKQKVPKHFLGRTKARQNKEADRDPSCWTDQPVPSGDSELNFTTFPMRPRVSQSLSGASGTYLISVRDMHTPIEKKSHQ